MVMSDKKREQYQKLINKRIEDPVFFDKFFGRDDVIIKKMIDDGYSDLLIDGDTGNIKIAGTEIDNQIYYNYFQKILSDTPIDVAALKIFKTLSTMFGDVIEKDGRLYLIINDDELVGFFSDSNYRGSSSADLVKNYYIGDSDYEPYDYFPNTTDYYDSIILQLTDENLNRLYEFMISNQNNGIPVNEESPDELIELANEQGHPDYVTLSIDILKEFDNETFVFILKTYFDEIYYDLGWKHNQANNQAWIDEIQSNIESELNGLFNHKIKRDTLKKTYYDGTNSYIDVFEVNITEKFVEIIMNFLKENYDSSYNDDTLDYWGSFVRLYQEYIGRYEDLLNVSVSDYADYNETREIFNEIVLDII
jgi:hypothetical protein